MPWRRRHTVERHLDLIVSLPTLHGPFDIIFIDADKKDYIEFYDIIMERKLLAQDGIILADNILALGCTVDSTVGKPSDSAHKNGAELRKFNDHIAEVARSHGNQANMGRMIVSMFVCCPCLTASHLSNGDRTCTLSNASNPTSPSTMASQPTVLHVPVLSNAAPSISTINVRPPEIVTISPAQALPLSTPVVSPTKKSKKKTSFPTVFQIEETPMKKRTMSLALRGK